MFTLFNKKVQPLQNVIPPPLLSPSSRYSKELQSWNSNSLNDQNASPSSTPGLNIHEFMYQEKMEHDKLSKGTRKGGEGEGIVGGRKVVPGSPLVYTLSDFSGVADTPRGSILSRSVSEKKLSRKLRKKDSGQTLDASDYSPIASPSPSRISHYWHDYGVPSSPSIISTSRSSTSEPLTNDLANRLSKLAVSYSDGALNEEQYRKARAEVFSQFAAEEEMEESDGVSSRFGEQFLKLDEACKFFKFTTTKISMRLTFFSFRIVRIPKAFGFLNSLPASPDLPINVLSPTQVRSPSLLGSPIRLDSPLRRTSNSSLGENRKIVYTRSPSSASLSSSHRAQSPLIKAHHDLKRDTSNKSTRQSSSNSSSISSPLRASISSQVSIIPVNRLGLDPVLSSSATKAQLLVSEASSIEVRREIAHLGAEWSRSEESWERLERAEITRWEEKLGPSGLNHFTENSGRRPSASGSIEEEVDLASEQMLVVVEGIRSRKRKNEVKYEERIKSLRAKLSSALARER